MTHPSESSLRWATGGESTTTPEPVKCHVTEVLFHAAENYKRAALQQLPVAQCQQFVAIICAFPGFCWSESRRRYEAALRSSEVMRTAGTPWI